MVTDIFRAYVKSYKDLPLNLYHIQWKFRDEVRPRFGVMRSREFLMKDAYSFDLDFEGAKAAYYRMFVAYLRTFSRLGLQAIPMRAETGPIGGDLSHEFIILADTGESEVFCHRDYLGLPVPGADVDFTDDAEIAGIVAQWTAPYAATDDMHDEAAWADVPMAERLTARGIEVGHIFHFGTKYSKPMNAIVTGPDGKEHFVSMGSYGIGPTRLVAAIIEASHDEAGIIWPEPVAPFDVGAHQHEAGRRRVRPRVRGALCRTRRGRPRGALRRHRRTRRRQVRHRRPDRPADAGHRRAARRRRRRGRGQEPRHRRARDDSRRVGRRRFAARFAA